MGSRQFDGANDDLSLASAMSLAVPLTLAAWVRVDNATPANTPVILSVGTSGQLNQRWTLEIDTNGAARATARTTGSDFATTSTTFPDTTAFHLLVATFTSSTARAAYIDGGSKGTDTASRAPSGMNQTRLGLNHEGSNDFAGYIAHAGIWNIALSDSDVTALWNSGNGTAFGNVQGANLVAYWKLNANTSPEEDEVGANDLTVTGATFSANSAPPDTVASLVWTQYQHRRSTLIVM